MRTLLIMACLLAAGQPVTAQESGTSPHGVIPESLDCSSCHKAQTWTDLRDDMDFEHGGLTGFSLERAHETPACISCHVDARFDLPGSSECVNCHEDVHAGALSENCSDCHTPTRFDDVDGLVVHMRTSFPLTGAHVQVACESCHFDDHDGFLSPLETDCESCHLDDFEMAQAIDHVANGFSSACQDCHGTIAWGQGGLFDHLGVSGFELEGAHARVSCANCHGGPNLALTVPRVPDSDCFSCHEADYSESHRLLDFPTACAQCHSSESWGDAQFPQHDAVAFPIYSGDHRGEWDSCQTCHDSGAFQEFTCFSCHEHNQPDTDDDHRGVGGYVYESVACLSCHPDGNEDE
jgi:hypothetical protein